MEFDAIAIGIGIGKKFFEIGDRNSSTVMIGRLPNLGVLSGTDCMCMYLSIIVRTLCI